eukprot:UN22598
MPQLMKQNRILQKQVAELQKKLEAGETTFLANSGDTATGEKLETIKKLREEIENLKTEIEGLKEVNGSEHKKNTMLSWENLSAKNRITEFLAHAEENKEAVVELEHHLAEVNEKLLKSR